MDPIKLMKINKTNLTDSEIKIMEYFIKHGNNIEEKSIIEIAQDSNSSKSALLRFAQKLGYAGFSEFKFHLLQHFNNLPTIDSNDQEITVSKSLSKTIQQLDETIVMSEINKLKQFIQDVNKIKIFGVAETGLAAMHLEYKLIELGYDTEAVTLTNKFPQKIKTSATNDLLIFLSLSANTTIIQNSIDLANKLKLKTALISQNSLFQKKAALNVFLQIPFPDNVADGLEIDSQVILFSFINILYNYIKTGLY